MFRAVPPPIIRSTELYIQLQALSTNGVVDEMERQFHLIHDTSLQQYWLTIPVAECTVMCS